MADLFTAKTASFDRPVEMLSTCHEKLRRQLDTLERLYRHLPVHGADAEAVQAARGVLKYFDNAEPHHIDDEEKSLFPRLLVATQGAAEPLLGSLRAEHAALASMWRELRPDLAAIAAGQRSVLDPAVVKKIRAAYSAHLEREDGELLPLVERTLRSEDLALVGVEMAARRGVAASAT